MLNLINNFTFYSDFLCSSSKRKKDEELQLFKEYSEYFKLLTIVCSMFDTQGVPDSVNLSFMELFAHNSGLYAYAKCPDGEERVLPCSLSGELDAYGMAKNAVIYQLNGEVFNRTRGVDCVVGFNTPTMLPDLDTYLTAQQLSEILNSARFNVFYSKNVKIPVVRDAKDKELVDTALNNMRTGKLTTIAVKRDEILKYLDENNADAIETLELTNPETSHNLQYLSKYYDDLLSRYLTFNGLSINFSGKMAQMSTAEVTGYHDFSSVMPNTMLKARQEFWNEVNKIFGHEITVDFSDAWKKQENEARNTENEETEMDEERGEENDDRESNESVE